MLRNIFSSWIACAGLLLASEHACFAQAPATEPDTSARILASSTTGTFKVDSTSGFILRDEKRERDISCTVRVPIVAPGQHAGPFPLVIFSHGMGGSESAFASLVTLWASHGYVVVAPSHADSLALADDKPGALRDFAKNPKAYTRNVDPLGRVADVKLIIDQLGTLEEKIPALHDSEGKGRVDRAKIAVAGHSAGAMTAQLSVGVKARVIDKSEGERLRDALSPRSFADDRIKAGIIISGQGFSSRMFTEDSWKHVGVPLFVITHGLMFWLLLRNENEAAVPAAGRSG